MSEIRIVYCHVQIRLDPITHLLHWPRKTMMQTIVMKILYTLSHIHFSHQSSVNVYFTLCFLILVKINWQSCWRTEKNYINYSPISSLCCQIILVGRSPKVLKSHCFFWDFSLISSHIQFWSCILKKSNSSLGNCSKHIFCYWIGGTLSIEVQVFLSWWPLHKVELL